MTKLRVLGVNIHLDLAELQILEHLQEGAGISEAEALLEVIAYKREQAMLYEGLGNFALAEHLLKSIDEWDDTRAEMYRNQEPIIKPEPKIIITK